MILLICFTLTCELQNEFFHLRIIHCYMHRHFLTMSPPPPFFFSCVFYGCTRLLDIWRKVRLLHFVYEIIPLRSLFHCNSWLLWVTFFIYLWNTLNVSRLFFMLRRFPIESKGRRKKLNELWAFSFKCLFDSLISMSLCKSCRATTLLKISLRHSLLPSLPFMKKGYYS